MRKILMSLLLSSLILISGSSYKAYAKECPIGLSNYKCSISCTGDWQVAIDTSNPYTCFGLGGGACCKKTEEALSKENTCGGEGGECKSVNPSDNEHVCHQAGSWGDYGCGTNEHCWICYENVNYDRTMDEIDPEESALIDVAKQQREDAIRHNYAPPVDRGYSGPIFTSFTDVVAPVAKVLYYAGVTIGVGAVILAGYMLMTSEGNPDRVKQGQEQLTAAILGVLFILLSAAILRIIIGTFFGLGF